jgi:hypothetical protein
MNSGMSRVRSNSHHHDTTTKTHNPMHTAVEIAESLALPSILTLDQEPEDVDATGKSSNVLTLSDRYF